MGKQSLTPKQEHFAQCAAYMNYSDAYREAYDAEKMSPRTINFKAWQLAQQDKIRIRINHYKKLRMDAICVDSDFLKFELSEMIHADIADIIDEETGCYKRIHDWPKIWRKMLTGMDVKEMFDLIKQQDPDDAEVTMKAQEKIGDILKMKFVDPLKLRQLAGSHKDIKAFQTNVEHGVTESLAEQIERARRRQVSQGEE